MARGFEMNQENIIAMAEEAGIRLAWASDAICPKNVYVHELLRFAKLAVQAEREACAKVVEDYTGAWNDQGYALTQAIRARGKNDS